MPNIIDFLIRFKNTLLFFFLLIIALSLVFQTHAYQKSKFISSANGVSGGLYSVANNIDEYLHLKKANKRLMEENQMLRERLYNVASSAGDSTFVDTTHYPTHYTVYEARVVANHYAKLDNYLLINKGRKEGIKAELGVITSKGIVGVIEKASTNYARVISILNTNLSVSAQLKRSNHFGTLKWDGGNPNIMELIDVPSYAVVKKGDTVMTDGRSLIFPKGIPIGTVKDFTLVEGQSYYRITVKLFNDMTSIGNVYVIKNNARPEIESLETTTDEQ